MDWNIASFPKASGAFILFKAFPIEDGLKLITACIFYGIIQLFKAFPIEDGLKQDGVAIEFPTADRFLRLFQLKMDWNWF